MNMTEFVNAMMETIPNPETLRQEMVQKCVEKIVVNLRENGRATMEWDSSYSSRAICLQISKRVKEIFDGSGYRTYYQENSENNHRCYCWLNVALP